MKKYIICIEEMVSKEFEVIAEDEENAMRIAEENYKSGKFVLAPGTLVGKQMAIVFPNDSTTEWTEFK